MMPASVSVVIPCFNAEKTILRALESVRAQTQPVWEIICVDDCSTDTTHALIEAFRDAHPELRVHLLQTTHNSGPSTARNLGWDAASGDYIAFLDADDVWHPQKIEIQYAWLCAHPHIDLCGHAHLVDQRMAKANTILSNTTPRAYVITPSNILLSNPFVTPSVMVKRQLAFRFDPKRKYTEDYLLWMRICLRGYRVVMLDTPLTWVERDASGAKLSHNYVQMRIGDIQNYWQLWHERHIGFFKMLLLVSFSFIKFILLLTFPSMHTAIKRHLFTTPLEENL